MFSIYSDLDCKIRDIKEKTDVVENNHKKTFDLLNRLSKVVEKPDYLEDKKEKLEDDLEVDDIISNANKKDTLEEKIAYLSLGIDKYPENANLFHLRGYYFNEFKKYEEAIKDNDKVLEFDSNYSMAYNNRGFAKNNLKQYEEAIKDYDKAIELDPNYPAAYYNRGCTKNELKQNEEAIKDFDKAIELDPNDSLAYNNIGLAKNNLKQYEEAIKDFNKVIELDTNNSAAYNNRGSAKNNLRKYEEAVQDFDKAIELDANNPNPLRHKGFALIKLGKFEDAEKSIKKAIELDNEYANAYATLAVLFATKGEIELFYENFEIALQKDIDLDRFNELEDETIEPFLKEERFLNLLKKYGKALK
jgi:tetratricopeptide (TPR) repeat protein